MGGPLPAGPAPGSRPLLTAPLLPPSPHRTARSSGLCPHFREAVSGSPKLRRRSTPLRLRTSPACSLSSTSWQKPLQKTFSLSAAVIGTLRQTGGARGQLPAQGSEGVQRLWSRTASGKPGALS